MGLNQHDWKDFQDFLIKANDMQLERMKSEIKQEMEKRDGVYVRQFQSF